MTTPNGALGARNQINGSCAGLVKCGHCGVGVSCHKMRGRNGAFHYYYYCRNHNSLSWTLANFGLTWVESNVIERRIRG